MYRALTRAALDSGIQLDDEPAMAELAGTGRIEYRFLPDSGMSVHINGEDATDRLRAEDVDSGVSTTAALPAVRAILVARQQEIAGEAPIVMVGRDIGTVVLPGAEVKIYLTASAEERARRRHEENMRLGIDGTYDEILRAIRRRDRIDSDRAASPLKPAEDSVLLDSDNKSVGQVVDEIVELAESVR
jgi:cytidylate kinase